MFDELNQALENYHEKWHKLVGERKDKAFFESLHPTAVGWKATDLAEYDELMAKWRGACDQIFVVWLNDRWIAKLHLRDTKLSGGIEIIKIMQRRPGSTDAVGLDHLDFYSSEASKSKLESEEGLEWTEESNGFCKWLSVWFDGTEAKLRTETIIDVCIAELEDTNKKVLAPAK